MDVQIIGFGNIGRGLGEVLSQKEQFLKERFGLDIKTVSVTDITGTVSDEKGLDLAEVLKVVKETGEVIKCPGAAEMNGVEAIKELDADIVAEVTPSSVKTGQPGLDHMMAAFGEAKHVVTSNKGPLALKYTELVNTAHDNNVRFMFEASVGGAMPIINLAKKTLSGDEILGIEGILNGTTNYILTRMTKEGSEFETVLREAQELGIAETDPTYDIEGIDTASKLVILANAIMNADATYKDVDVKGITGVTPEAIKLAKHAGFVIKLVGGVHDSTLEVVPRLVPKNHPLNVDGALNVAQLKTDIAGDVTVVGQGAGRITTQSAIISDLVSVGRHLK
jgi:homoserine dehydrogenase